MAGRAAEEVGVKVGQTFLSALLIGVPSMIDSLEVEVLYPA